MKQISILLALCLMLTLSGCHMDFRGYLEALENIVGSSGEWEYVPYEEGDAEAVFVKRLNGEEISRKDITDMVTEADISYTEKYEKDIDTYNKVIDIYLNEENFFRFLLLPPIGNTIQKL